MLNNKNKKCIKYQNKYKKKYLIAIKASNFTLSNY